MPPVERSPDVFRSSMPFLFMGFAMMALIMVFPPNSHLAAGHVGEVKKVKGVRAK